MRKMALASVAIIALSMPALAMDQNSGMNNDSNAAQNSAAQSNPAPNSTAQGTNSGSNAMQSNSSQQSALSPEKLDKNVIMNVQQALNKKGFDAGHVDGVWGHDTVAAIKNFQEKNNLKADGKLDQETMAALGLSNSQEPTTTGSGAATEQQPSSGPASPDQASKSQPQDQSQPQPGPSSNNQNKP